VSFDHRAERATTAYIFAWRRQVRVDAEASILARVGVGLELTIFGRQALDINISLVCWRAIAYSQEECHCAENNHQPRTSHHSRNDDCR